MATYDSLIVWPNKQIYGQVYIWLKRSFITPLFEDCWNEWNYRPVCIQSDMSKVSEKMLMPKLEHSFKNIVTEFQHGYVRGRSTSIHTIFSKVLDLLYQKLCICVHVCLGWLPIYISNKGKWIESVSEVTSWSQSVRIRLSAFARWSGEF